MIYLKEFAKSVGILFAASIFYGLTFFLSLGLAFSLHPDSSFPYFLGFVLMITAPAILLIFAFRAWRLYKKQGIALIATSLATLFIYTVAVFLFGSNSFFFNFNIFSFYTAPIIQNYENNSLASQVKISPSKICIVRDSSTNIADVGTCTFSLPQYVIRWGLVWNGSITTTAGATWIQPTTKFFKKNDPSSWEGIAELGGQVYVEMPEGSGTYVRLGGNPPEIPAEISNGRAHKLRLTISIEPATIKYLKEHADQNDETSFAVGLKVTIDVRRPRSVSNSSYTTTIPDTVIEVILANATSTESTPYTFCDSP